MEDLVGIGIDKKTFQNFLELAKIKQESAVNLISAALDSYIKDECKKLNLKEEKKIHNLLVEG